MLAAFERLAPLAAPFGQDGEIPLSNRLPTSKLSVGRRKNPRQITKAITSI
jgi:hypothetical protein